MPQNSSSHPSESRHLPIHTRWATSPPNPHLVLCFLSRCCLLSRKKRLWVRSSGGYAARGQTREQRHPLALLVVQPLPDDAAQDDAHPPADSEDGHHLPPQPRLPASCPMQPHNAIHGVLSLAAFNFGRVQRWRCSSEHPVTQEGAKRYCGERMLLRRTTLCSGGGEAPSLVTPAYSFRPWSLRI